MSQEKVEKRKQEKYNRKSAPKKSNIKKYFSYAGATVIAAAFVIYFGYSVAIETGLYTPPETTTEFVGTISAEDLATQLDSMGDPIGFYSEAKEENSTAASEDESTAAIEDESATSAEETSAAE